MFTATKELKWEGAHRLVGHRGLCQYIHGHSFKLQITLYSLYLNELGMVQDFSEIKAHVQNFIDEKLDHALILNEQDPFLSLLKRESTGEYGFIDDAGNATRDILSRTFVVPFNPTSENMAKFFYDMLVEKLEKTSISVSKVTLFESATCFATFSVN